MGIMMRPKRSAHQQAEIRRLKRLLIVTENERQHAQIPDITPKEASVTETERFCALVQVMLHFYENNVLDEGKVIDNSRSVIDGSWSIFIKRSSAIITRY